MSDIIESVAESTSVDETNKSKFGEYLKRAVQRNIGMLQVDGKAQFNLPTMLVQLGVDWIGLSTGRAVNPTKGINRLSSSFLGKIPSIQSLIMKR